MIRASSESYHGPGSRRVRNLSRVYVAFARSEIFMVAGCRHGLNNSWVCCNKERLRPGYYDGFAWALRNLLSIGARHTMLGDFLA